jgi:uncharacterized protein
MKEEAFLYPWREHLPRIARKATLSEAKKRWNIEKELVNYRWEHVQAVVRLGVKLARITGADDEVVEAAAWLHDIRKKGKNDDHGEEGAKAAKEILATTDFPIDKIDLVAAAINKHVGLYKDHIVQPLEAAVLWDADKLSKLGNTSILHYFLYWMSKGNETVDQMIAHAGTAIEWQEKTVKSFNTKPAIQAGRNRLKSQKVFWDQLLQELDGNDLDVSGKRTLDRR